MTKLEQNIRSFADGEATCRACSVPLPAHQTWPSSIFRWCSEASCLLKMKDATVGRYIGPKQIGCSGPGFSNFVAEGCHDRRSKLLYCCASCRLSRLNKGTRPYIFPCGCGATVLGTNYYKRGAEQKHYAPGHQRNVEEEAYFGRLGQHANLMRQYLTYARQRFTDISPIRAVVGHFLAFLASENIEVQDVTPKTITAFLNWADREKRLSLKFGVPFISTFFKWTLAFGHRTGGSPVIAGFHGLNRTKKSPRPLGESEEETLWRLLQDSGNSMLRLVCAIGEEAGLRIFELAALRIDDVDVRGRRIRVRLPNKGNTERWVFFSDKTVNYLKEWLAERDQKCWHNYLFYNHFKRPPTDTSLRAALNKTLIKKHVSDADGFDSWSTHRLRHSMASNLALAGADVNVIMKQGGWRTLDAMQIYTKPNEDLARSGYDAAMRLAKELKKAPQSKRSLDLSEVLSWLEESAKSNSFQ